MSKNDVLPDLTEASAWAHVQVAGKLDDAAALPGILETTPQRALARIVCPRVLEPKTAYTACLVPTFESGRLAGLGEDGGKDLPVYYSWRFLTGTVASFEALVRELKPRVLPETVGLRPLDVSDPGHGLPPAASGALGLEGALRTPAMRSTPWPAAERTAWVQELRKWLETKRVVGPPLYGRWPANQSELPEEGGEPPWFFELNADPRLRVAAALGTQVVQRDQQNLMAAAWLQVGEIQRINEELRMLQLGRETCARLHERHVQSLAGAEEMLLFTRSVHGRVRSDGAGTPRVAAVLEDSPIAPGIFDPQWRRLSRPLGPVGRRQGRAPGEPSTIAGRMNRWEFRPDPPPSTPTGLVTPESAAPEGFVLTPRQRDALRRLDRKRLVLWGIVLFWKARLLLKERPWVSVPLLRLALRLIRASRDRRVLEPRGGLFPGVTPDEVARRPIPPGFTLANDPLEEPAGASSDEEEEGFRAALGVVVGELATPPLPGPVKTEADLPVLAAALLDALDPQQTVGRSIGTRLALDPVLQGRRPSDPLEPLRAAPVFPQPMAVPLGELSQDWLLPGLGDVPPSTITLLETNQRFVEAYMVGLNHEMARELLWNEYPADLRATFFRQFWSRAGAIPEDGEELRDIADLHAWSPSSQLGGHSPRTRTAGLVLLVRGWVLASFPGLSLYAMLAREVAGTLTLDESREEHPVFQGRLPPDVGFFGFALDEARVRSENGLGWFFVLQEPPAEPRFAWEGEAIQRVRPFRIAVHAERLLSNDEDGPPQPGGGG